MKWEKLTKNKANEIFIDWTNNNTSREFSASLKYEEFHKDIKLINYSVRNKMSVHEVTKTASYFYDLNFGMELYMLMKDKYKFTVREASDDEIWNYISMCVIPDIIEERWGLSEARYFKESRRIWLKTIWWYIHLSWNQNKEQTLKILEGLTTDEIVQLVERVGPYGYRVSFTRELMKELYEIDDSMKSRNLFRQIMKLNTARVKLVEPTLYPGGTKKYVKELINYFENTLQKV